MTYFQKPNLPLIILIAAWIFSELTGQGLWHDISMVVFAIAVFIWASWELLAGINWFRRLLGAAFLVSLGISLLHHHF